MSNAKFSAQATSAACNYTRTAEMADADFAGVLDAVRGVYATEVLTDEQCVDKMLGKMLLEWTQLAAFNKAEAARKAAQTEAAPQWTIVA